MRSIPQIIKMCGGVKDLHIIIDNPPYMSLSIDDIGAGPRGYRAVSVATFFYLNGDCCVDPELSFELVRRGSGFSYQPFLFYVAASAQIRRVYDIGDPKKVNREVQRELKSFAQSWDQDLRTLGFVKAAQKLQK